jgi:pimeloyl-ACP methyl ester carboxylesterase
MRRFAGSGLLALLMLALAGSSRADLIFFKDGFVLQGKVKREGTNEYDSVSREFTWMPKGMYFIDDYPRRVYFTPTQVAIVERLAPPNEERIVRSELFVTIGRKAPPMEDVDDVKEWDFDKWQRMYTYKSVKSNVSFKQKITAMTPYYLQADAITNYKLTSCYLTREFDAQTVYKLIKAAPHLQDSYMPPRPVIRTPPKKEDKEGKDKGKTKDGKDDKDKKSKDDKAAKDKKAKDDKPAKDEKDRKVPGGKDDKDKKDKDAKDKKEEKKKEEFVWPEKPTPGMIVARRMRICDFLAQAGYFDYAEKELDRLLKDYPDQKKRVEEGRALVAQLRARDDWEQIKNWYHAGRLKAVRKRIDNFPVTNVPDKILADLREMKATIAATDDLLAEANKALDACAKEASKEGKYLASAAGVIKKELDATTVERLDAFLGQYREAERQKARKKVPPYNSDELLALAVSGWLLGSPSAEPKPAVATSLWKTRDMVLNYCADSDHEGRKKVLAAYEKEVEARLRPDFEEIAQMITLLPPLDPGKITDEVTEVKVGKRNQTTYHLQLPPEYSHGRAYPVLIVLHNTGEKATAMLSRWKKAAADNGFILVAPEWEVGLKQGYAFSEREHDTVLDAIRDLRRRFSIDSDRVFLFGWGDGGKMAFDVGLSHPDLFAGVVPMGAGPYMHANRCWRNAQYLPFYVICGDYAPAKDAIRMMMEKWTLRGYPALYVEYKGRGGEWLGGEVPHVFDWMRHQQRAFPLKQLGNGGRGDNFGNEFCTMRAEDNRFYWLTTSDIHARHIASADRWNNLVQPAAMTARIDTTTDEKETTIYFNGQGLGQVSIWLGRSPKGQMMLDFEKRVVVRVGLQAVFNKVVKPGLSVLLEDLAARGDRKHLYFARIDLTLRR